ncbi:hypothetical protein [Pararhodobacter sp.]|uniref:hypothetical protein n=1 Tax=Pararhodobacter sp. TaxID=2127056 RepID=UPI002B002F77|nr:hypothetical protein [Pararhodobacter sp.]
MVKLQARREVHAQNSDCETAVNPVVPDIQRHRHAAHTGREAAFRENPTVRRFHDILSTPARISSSDGKNRRMFKVKSYRCVIRSNAAQTAVLSAFLKATPQVTTAAPSYLDPGKHIPRHRAVAGHQTPGHPADTSDRVSRDDEWWLAARFAQSPDHARPTR